MYICWERVLSTDDSKFNIFNLMATKWSGEKQDLVSAVKYRDEGVLMWEYMSAAGVDELVFIKCGYAVFQ